MINSDKQAITVTARRYNLLAPPDYEITRYQADDIRLPTAVIRYLKRTGKLGDKNRIVRAAVLRMEEKAA